MHHEQYGPQNVREMICDDIRAALHAENMDQAQELFAVVRGFPVKIRQAARGMS